MSAVFADLQAIRKEIATRNKLGQQLKQTIQQMMGNSSQALFETGSVSWKRSEDGTPLDTDRLEADHPDQVKPYLSPKASSRRFLIHA